LNLLPLRFHDEIRSQRLQVTRLLLFHRVELALGVENLSGRLSNTIGESNLRDLDRGVLQHLIDLTLDEG
jgi:hypothetical protein